MNSNPNFFAPMKKPILLYLTTLALAALCGGAAAGRGIEEFPLAEKYMEREDDAHWLFHTEVCKYEGIGRFVLGLFEDIEIINSPDFVLYLKEKVQNISEKIQD